MSMKFRTLSRIEPATFRLVTQCLNQLRYQQRAAFAICTYIFYMYLQPYCNNCKYQRKTLITKITNEKITLKKVT
jgi:hypothetical protein